MRAAKVELMRGEHRFYWDVEPHSGGSGKTLREAVRSFKRFCNAVDARGPFKFVGDNAEEFSQVVKQAK